MRRNSQPRCKAWILIGSARDAATLCRHQIHRKYAQAAMTNVCLKMSPVTLLIAADPGILTHDSDDIKGIGGRDYHNLPPATVRL